MKVEDSDKIGGQVDDDQLITKQVQLNMKLVMMRSMMMLAGWWFKTGFQRDLLMVTHKMIFRF